MPALEYNEQIEVKASIKDVWEAIVDPELVEKYHLAPLKLIEPKVHGRIIYGTDDSDLIAGKITEIIPYKLLKHSFMFETPCHRGSQVDPESKVCYELDKKENSTLLTVKHSGFLEANQTYVNITGAWPMMLNHMKALLEKD